MERESPFWTTVTTYKKPVKRNIPVILLALLILTGYYSISLFTEESFVESTFIAELSDEHPLYEQPNSPLSCSGSDRKKDLLVLGSFGAIGSQTVEQMLIHMGWSGDVLNNAIENSFDCTVTWNNNIEKNIRKFDYTIDEFLRIPTVIEIVEKINATLNSNKCYASNHTRRSCFWGWKHLDTQYLIPVYHHLDPDMKFIFVIRDGRDMALYPGNPTQFLQFFDQLEATNSINYLRKSERIMAFWNEVTLEIARVGEQLLGDRFLLVRIEDLLTSDHATRYATIRRIFQLVRPNDVLAEPQLRSLGHLFEAKGNTSPRFELWRAHPEEDLIRRLQVIGWRALSKFGYVTPRRNRSP